MAVHNVMIRIQIKIETETIESSFKKDNYGYCNFHAEVGFSETLVPFSQSVIIQKTTM
jgi:hypothetical protein